MFSSAEKYKDDHRLPLLYPRNFQALEAATSALMTFPRHVALRAKTMFLVHGLIPCLGEGLLRALPLTALLALVQEGDGKDLMEVKETQTKPIGSDRSYPSPSTSRALV